MLRRILLASIGAALVAGLTACEPLAPQMTSETGSGSESNAPSAKATEYDVGDAVKIGTMQIKVNKVTRLPVTNRDKPQRAGDIFVAVDLTVTNGGTKPQSINNLLIQMSLTDSKGQRGHPTIHSKAKNPPAETLDPGAETSGHVVYLISGSAKDLQLVYDASALGAGEVVWSLGDASQIK